MKHEAWKVFETVDGYTNKPTGFGVGPTWASIIAHRIENKEDAELIASAPALRAILAEAVKHYRIKLLTAGMQEMPGVDIQWFTNAVRLLEPKP